ncbi:probable amino acid permease 7 isoform X1 [Ziziphus jujuba]|uniref:Probable amino acid permease 7 isoform X1 n=1 Tax=Ziziphus jujuba TaxID=326968 RepID=A0ABM3IJX0_ZIZJJ|nr:probable amino acid permease 7 isoform X1 [Ziziphus jujuba]XP_048329927.2 probable amino acid permease 7 isoform X1 [Ziziphus jujuba]
MGGLEDADYRTPLLHTQVSEPPLIRTDFRSKLMGVLTDADDQTSLLHAQISKPSLIRTGNVWTAVAHIITGVIGSGALSVAWSMAQLGWIAGPLAMLFFPLINLTSAFLLCNCYRSPDPEYGLYRNRTYLEAVHNYLGNKNALVCGLFLQVNLFGTAVVYTVTSAISLRAILNSYCYPMDGMLGNCEYGDASYMLLFGVVQILLSQLPNFHNLKWLSIVAAIMSFGYCFIGLGLGFAKVVGNVYIKGSIAGISTSTAAEKTLLVSQALGDILFAYPYSIILIEIQDTLKSPPPENQTMKKASIIAVAVTTFLYLCCGGFGYAAFGDETPGNLLTGFESYGPRWLINFAHACIVLHLVGGYQIYCQPLFANVEKWFAEVFPHSRFVKDNYTVRLPLLPVFTLNPLRLCFRTTYVVSTTGIAIIFPYFNQILGVLGGVNFFPISIYFPVKMYSKQTKLEAWTAKWLMLQIFSIVCLFITVFTSIGSIQGLISKKLS